MGYASQRVDFQTLEFKRLIEQKGYSVVWEKASKCPCIPDEGSAQPDFNCKLCHGKGWYWFDQKEIQGIMTNFNETLRYNQTGEIAKGTSYFTTLPENKIGFWDRVTHLHSSVRHSEVITKGNHGAKDLLKFQPEDIVHCRTINKTYLENVDFIFNKLSYDIEWITNGSEPVTGERYSIEYTMRPRWIVIDIVNVIRDTYVKSKKAGITFTELPLRALVRLEWMVFGVIDP